MDLIQIIGHSSSDIKVVFDETNELVLIKKDKIEQKNGGWKLQAC